VLIARRSGHFGAVSGDAGLDEEGEEPEDGQAQEKDEHDADEAEETGGGH
jgi:hypothetical protein